MKTFFSHLPATFSRWCPIHIFYTLIVFYDIIKAIVCLFYLISSIALPTNPAQRVPFLVPIAILVLMETITGCVSRWRGFVYNKARLHLSYVISRVLFTLGVIPLVTVGAGLGCAEDSSEGCYKALITCNAIWFTVETWFTFIVYKIYRKTVNGEYVIYGIPAFLGRSLEPLPFQSTDDAVVVEIRGIKVEQEREKNALIKLTTMATETDLQSPIDIERCEGKEETLEAVVVSVPIGKKAKKHVAKGEIGVYIGNKEIKPEHVDLTIKVK